ncbi:zinc-dependent metalloprotease [Streptomyces sp. PTM05]|uniref:Zinc-dependent metalloprotease n=1 Tax=Streptantibioticus parmotrematis TaxID=2873249 RepID=A0ABS7QYG7_9ACTN|nr:zinc-dependent metalloprotease [Streptantibioticus parmotrematis]MBY8888260.1 zinc-dependent metalloprotease [Streptantibioticus parmotrematis]
MSDTPFGFGVPPEEPEDGGEGATGKGRGDGGDDTGGDKGDKGQGQGDGKAQGGDQGQGGSQGAGQGQGPGGNPFGFSGLPGGFGGFGLPGGPGGPGAPGAPGADNPLAAMFGSLNPNDLGAAFQQLGQMLSYEGGPVNWEMAKDIARQTVAQGAQDGSKDASVGASERAAVQEALRLADLWLDGTTSLPSGSGGAVAWSRAEWVEATLPVWKELVDPVAERVGTAMGGVLPEEMQAMAGPLLGMMRSMGGAMFGTQIGQALGVLAGEVVGSTDVGLPLGPAGKAALLPANVAAFGSGLGVPEDQVRLYLALREAAHQRLFAHVPWLRAHLFGAVEGYARGIKVDTARLEDAVGQLDPANPQALQDALQQGMFQPEDTPEQKAALARLETALALVEGWVDAVVHAAAAPHLPSAGALRETLRRRRATGGPAEQTFATLIGLELRPRRLRDASRLWASLTDARGVDGRDALWAHPDMLPTAADLDDPDGFVHREAEEAFDFDALDRMLGDAARGEGGGSKGSKEDGGPSDDGPSGDGPSEDGPSGSGPAGTK